MVVIFYPRRRRKYCKKANTSFFTRFLDLKQVTRQKTNDNALYTTNLDLTVTFANDIQVNGRGLKVSEWIEGFFNNNWGDDVFLITGVWETNFRNENIVPQLQHLYGEKLVVDFW